MDTMLELVPPSDDVESAATASGASAAILNRRARRLSKRQNRRAAESSNAEVPPQFFDKLDKRLNTESGGPTTFRWAMRGIDAG